MHPTTRRRAFGVAVAAVLLAAGGAVAANAASSPNAPLAPLKTTKGKVITGQYIVVLKPGVASADAAKRHGVTPERVYNRALRGYSAKLTAAQLKAVRADSSVAYVEPDQVAGLVDKPLPKVGYNTAPKPGVLTGPHPAAPGGVSAQSLQTGATWGLDRIDQRVGLDGSYHYTSTGAGVTAYVIDTGIYTAHSDFGGRAVGGFTAVSDGNGTNDCHGHGTHVAGTIGGTTYGVAKGVRLVAVRVLDCGGSGSYSAVISGIDWVTNTHDGPSVANMSLGGGFSQALNDAVTNSIGSGVEYALAAGNSNDNACNYSPSSTVPALTVGATDSGDARAYFSNYGTCVDVFAPGVNITSDWIGSTTATATISGTSMASPHVAGLVATYLQANPTATQAVVNQVIKVDAAAGVVTDPAGSPNLLARRWNGALTAQGSVSFEPDGSYWYQANGGWISAWLQGTAGTDPDLYLQKWNGSAWVYATSSSTTSPRERISYLGSSGYYRIMVYAFAGAASYDVFTTHPA